MIFFYCQPFRRYMFRSTIKDTRTAAVMLFSPLEVQSRELYNKNMIALTQITNSEIFAFITLPVFKILIPKVLFINRKDKRNLKSRLLFKKIANFTGKLLQNCKQLECKIFRILLKHLIFDFLVFSGGIEEATAMKWVKDQCWHHLETSQMRCQC